MHDVQENVRGEGSSGYGNRKPCPNPMASMATSGATAATSYKSTGQKTRLTKRTSELLYSFSRRFRRHGGLTGSDGHSETPGR